VSIFPYFIFEIKNEEFIMADDTEFENGDTDIEENETIDENKSKITKLFWRYFQ